MKIVSEAVRRFVEQNVLACVTTELEAVLELSREELRADLPAWEDVQNTYQRSCPKCEYVDETFKRDICPRCNIEMDFEPQDILAWHIVTRHLAKKLVCHGQPILHWGDNYYWGQTSNAAPYEEPIIHTIYAEDALCGTK